MSNSKIPTTAFAFYLGLGPGRSYQLVANQFHVTKQAVVRHAKKENWQHKLLDAERKLAVRGEEQAAETLDAMNERHVKLFHVIAKRALEALRNFPIESAMAAVRSLDLAIKGERLVRGEPGERSAVDVEQIIRAEYQRWMVIEGDAKKETAS